MPLCVTPHSRNDPLSQGACHVPAPAPVPRAARRAGRDRGCGILLAGSVAPAAAAPPPPPNPSDAQLNNAAAARKAAAAEVGRIAGLVAASEAELEKVGVQAEAAGAAYLEA